MNKKTRLFLTTILLIYGLVSCQAYEDKDLNEFIGLNINSSKVQNFVKDLEEYKIEKFAYLNDYHYINSGIKFRTDSLGIIIAIICNNCRSCIYSKYTGPLPFGLTFSDNLTEIENKIGKGTLLTNYGFYGRLFQWIVQDLYKVAIEVRLPRDETEKFHIEYMIFSKMEDE